MSTPLDAAIDLLARALYWGALSKHPAPSAIPEFTAPPEWQAHARQLLESAGLVGAVDASRVTVTVDRALVDAVREAEAMAARLPGCTCYDAGCARCRAAADVDADKLALADAVLAQVSK